MSDGVTLGHAVETAATGDVWLFRGKSLADLAIRTVTNAPVNHVGMVVAVDDLPPLLWHAELGRSLPDVWSGQRQRGVRCDEVQDVRREVDAGGSLAHVGGIVSGPAEVVGLTLMTCPRRIVG